MRKVFLLVFIAVFFLACPDKPDITDDIIIDMGPAVVQPGSDIPILPDFFGMIHTGYSNQLDREYTMLNEMGVEWVHRDFSWSSIQPNLPNSQNPDPTLSEVNWSWTTFDNYVQRANDEGKKIMGMLLYDVAWVHVKHGNPSGRRIWNNEIPDFVKYAEETVKRYNGKNGHGKVDVWFIWNEPDLAPRFWTDPATDPTAMDDFFALNKAVAGAIRKLDAEQGTHTVLVGGVFTSLVNEAWIDGLFEDGGMIEHEVDGIGFHPYSPSPAGSLAFLDVFKQRVAKYGYEQKIWVNELGYPTYPEKGNFPQGRYGTDQYEGDMPEIVTQTIVLMAAGGVYNLAWYHLFDSANRNLNDSEAWFGLVWRKSDEEWIKKGGYWGYTVCANNLAGTTYKKLNFPGKSIPANIENHYFEGADGKRVLVLWNKHPLVTEDVTIRLNGSNHRIWNVFTGENTEIESSSTYKLHTMYSGNQTLVFITWID